MEEIVSTSTYIRITIYMALLALSILSMRHFFRKKRLFGLALLLVFGTLLVNGTINYFDRPFGQVFSAVSLTLALIGLAIAWAVDFVSYDDD